MQSMFGENNTAEDYSFLNQGILNTSMNDFFDNLFNCGSDENSGSISDSPVSSPTENTNSSSSNLNFLDIPLIPPMVHIKQEIPEFTSPTSIEEKGETNKRKRANKPEKSDKGNKNSGSKKIRKKHPEMQTAVTLPREKLLTTSTEEFNKWVEDLKLARPLTQEEVQDIRRQKRLIRNRESAQASRDRKKSEFTLLEQQIKQLKEEKENALKELSEMRNKVDLLEKENLYMKTTIQHSPVLNEIYTGVGNFQSKSNFDLGTISKGAKTAGVCLFIIIFSLGLFFNAQNISYHPNSTQAKIYLPQQNLPRVSPIENVPSLRPIGTNARKLLSKTRSQLSSYENPPLAPNTVNTENIPGDTHESIPEVVPMSIKKAEISTNNETMPIFEQSLSPNLHLYCMNAREYVLNPNPSQNDLVFNLMLPRTSISPNSPFFRYINTQDDLIELTCKVVHK